MCKKQKIKKISLLVCGGHAGIFNVCSMSVSSCKGRKWSVLIRVIRAFAYISVENDGDSSNPQGEYKTIYSANSKDISTVEGISYDRASNTLTIENYQWYPKNRIAMNMMGDDFKINIKGENHIGELVSYGSRLGRKHNTYRKRYAVH